VKKAMSGSFRIQNIIVNYDFELMGPHKNDCIIRMQLQQSHPDPVLTCLAGIYLMHYLADDMGVRIDVNEIPKLATPEQMVDAVDKFNKGEKQ
jgi:hypothetical protein